MKEPQNTIAEPKPINPRQVRKQAASEAPVAAPVILTQQQINASKVAKFRAKNHRMLRCQFITYGIKGKKEMDLCWKIKEGNVTKRLVKHNDILELPYGYVKYLNEHGSIKKQAVTGLRLEDADGNPIFAREEDNERRYSVRVLDILSPEEAADLDPSLITRVRI